MTALATLVHTPCWFPHGNRWESSDRRYVVERTTYFYILETWEGEHLGAYDSLPEAMDATTIDRAEESAIPTLAALVTLYRLAPVVWTRTSEPRTVLRPDGTIPMGHTDYLSCVDLDACTERRDYAASVRMVATSHRETLPAGWPSPDANHCYDGPTMLNADRVCNVIHRSNRYAAA